VVLNELGSMILILVALVLHDEMRYLPVPAVVSSTMDRSSDIGSEAMLAGSLCERWFLLGGRLNQGLV
jgi:hypothetical protein